MAGVLVDFFADLRAISQGEVPAYNNLAYMRANGVIKLLSIDGGLPGEYAPGEPNAVCRRCIRFGADLPSALLPAARQKVLCMAFGRSRLQGLDLKSATEWLDKWGPQGEPGGMYPVPVALTIQRQSG